MYEEHAHVVTSPLTEKEARKKLDELTLTALHDIAMAEGIPTNNNRGSQMTGILLAWFHAGDGDRELSFQEVLDQAEKLPQGKRRAWRKRTHGKEMGF
jgi:hypothetical protein